MNAKIERVIKEIDKTKEKLTEFQGRLRELERQKTTSGQVGPKSEPEKEDGSHEEV